MDISIRNIDESDIGALMALMREFAEFEKLSVYLKVTETRLSTAMFGDDSFVQGLIVTDGSGAIGYALFYPYFASFRGQRGLYLEDIYIAAGYRGKGIGEAVLRKIATIARSRGFERMDFQVLEWNTPAVRFYEKLGAVRDAEERHFKFTGAAFESLAR